MPILQLRALLSSLLIATSGAAGPTTAPTPHPTDYQAVVLRDLVMKTSVLGHYVKGAGADGILFNQSTYLSRARTAIATGESAVGEIALAMSLDQAVIDWTYDFRDRLLSKQISLPLIYQKNLQEIPADAKDPFEEVEKKLSLEIDLRRFVIQYPLFQNHHLSRGMYGDQWRAFLEMERPDWKFGDALNAKIASDQTLNSDEFKSYFSITHSNAKAASDEVQAAYAKYLIYGRLIHPVGIDPQADGVSSRDDFYKRIKKIDDDLRVEPEDPVDIELAWQIYLWHMKNGNWSPDFQSAWTESRDFSAPIFAFRWFLKTYGEDPKFKLRIASLSKNLSDEDFEASLWEYKNIVDDLNQKDFPESYQNLMFAEDQIKRGVWAHLDIQKFAYYQLTDQERKNLIAHLFPDTHFAQAILEKKFFELNDSQKSIALEEFVPFEHRISVFMQSRDENLLQNPQKLAQFYGALLQEYLLAHEGAPPLDSDPEYERTPLLNGKSLLRSSALREQAETYLLKNEGKIHTGIPDWLLIHLRPSPDYWPDIWSRFKDSYERRAYQRSAEDQLNSLKKRRSESSSQSEQAKLEKEMLSVVTDYSKKIALGGEEDGSSPGVYAGTFVYGLGVHDSSDILRLSKDIGYTGLFLVVTSFTGGQFVAICSAGDLGLEILTSVWFSYSSRKSLDFEKGYSPLGVGKWSTEFFDFGFESFEAFINPAVELKDKLERVEKLGSLSSDLATFAGSAAVISNFARWHLGFQKIIDYRAEKSLQEQITKTKSKIRELSSRAQSLDQEIEPLEKDLNTFSKLSPPYPADYLELRRKILKLKLDRDQVIDGSQMYQNNLAFLTKQVIWQFLKVPLRTLEWSQLFTDRLEWQAKQRGLIEEFRRSSYEGIAHAEDRLVRQESELLKRQELSSLNELKAAGGKSAPLKKAFADFAENHQSFVEAFSPLQADLADGARSSERNQKAVEDIQNALQSFEKSFAELTKIADLSKRADGEPPGPQISLWGISERLRNGFIPIPELEQSNGFRNSYLRARYLEMRKDFDIFKSTFDTFQTKNIFDDAAGAQSDLLASRARLKIELDLLGASLDE